VNEVKCEIVGWVSDEPQPGLVEAELTDARGKTWRFVDKQTTFTSEAVRSSTAFPLTGAMRCEVLSRRVDAARTLVTLRTIDSDSDGQDRFEVEATQVAEWLG